MGCSLVGSSRRRAVSGGLMCSRSEKRVGVRGKYRPFSARPSDRRSGPESEASALPPWPGPPIGEAGRSRKRAPESEAGWPGLPVGEAGRSQRQALSLLDQAFQSERWPKVGGNESKRRFLLGQAFWTERRSRVSERHSSLARPSGRRLDHLSGLSLGFLAGPGVARRSQRRLLGRAFVGEQAH